MDLFVWKILIICNKVISLNTGLTGLAKIGLIQMITFTSFNSYTKSKTNSIVSKSQTSTWQKILRKHSLKHEDIVNFIFMVNMIKAMLISIYVSLSVQKFKVTFISQGHIERAKFKEISQICIKRSPLWQSKGGLLRQVTS